MRPKGRIARMAASYKKKPAQSRLQQFKDY